MAMGMLLLIGSVAAAISSAAGKGGVRIKGGDPVSAKELKDNQDINSVKYEIRSENGTKTVTRSGTSLATVVGLAGLTPGEVSYLTFRRADGTLLYLSRDDIFNPSFRNGLQVVISASGDAIRLTRPLRPGSSDFNGSDDFKTSADDPSLRGTSNATGNVLGVRIKASDSTPSKGSPVTFTASPKGRLPGETATVKWDFGDGSTATGTTVKHTYAKELKGTAVVTATATGSLGSGGQGSTGVRVGPANTFETQDPDDGPTVCDPECDDGSGSGSGGTTPPGPGTTDTNPDYNYPDYATPTYPSYPDYSGYPDYSTPPDPGTSPTPNNSTAPPGQQDPTQGLPVDPGLETVSGTLVTDLSGTAAPTGSDASEAASTPSYSSEATIDQFTKADSESSMTLPLTGMGVALLLLGGAGRELQGSRRRAL